MQPRQHSYLFYLATSFWTFYFLGGLWSDYYQTWPWWLSLVVVLLVPTVALAFLSRGLLLGFLRGVPSVAGACWIAFYMTVPLAFYDVLYLALFRKLGAGFLWSHWYLSAFYVIPWMLLPPLGANYQVRSSRGQPNAGSVE